MTDREKLIELLGGATVEQVFCSSNGTPVSRCICRVVAEDDVGPLADYLIANGLVIKKHGGWIMRGGKLYCSACQQRACVARDSDDFWYTKGTDCCPNCGAVMDLEVEQ